MRQPILLILLAVAMSYATIWAGTFQFDDHNVIVHNPVVHSWAAFIKDLPRGIRPVLKFTYTWNWVSGLGLFGFHLVNLLLHAANSVLLFFLPRLLFPTLSTSVALAAALLFALHPVQTEAVTYICGRSVSLMAFFTLASLLLYLLGRQQGRWVLSSLLSPLLFILAVLSKEVAVILPLSLVLCQTARADTGRGVWAGQGVHWALLMGVAWFVLAHPGYGRLLEACFDIRGIAVNGLTQVNAIAYLVTRLFLPHSLNIDPDLAVSTALTGQGAMELLVIMALLVAGWLGRRTVAGFGILWFFLHLLPTNSLIPRLDVVNDRQLYLASWGVFLGLAVWAERLTGRFAGRRWVVAAGVCLVLMTLGGLTLARNRVYWSEIALWEDTARKSPAKARVFNNLGYAYELAHRPAEAAEAYGRALALDPRQGPARINLRRLQGGRGGE